MRSRPPAPKKPRNEAAAALAAALKFEQEGREFYLSAAQKAVSDLARQTFRFLARSEEEHLSLLQRLAPAAAAAASAELERRLKPILAAVPESARRQAGALVSDRQALALAAEREARSRTAYRGWSSTLPDGPARTLCRLLAEMEQLHLEAVEKIAAAAAPPA